MVLPLKEARGGDEGALTVVAPDCRAHAPATVGSARGGSLRQRGPAFARRLTSRLSRREKRQGPAGSLCRFRGRQRSHGSRPSLALGLHRLEACRQIGWEAIEASVVTLGELDAELAQIDENLIRNELTALERGEHLARRKAIYEALHPQTKQGVAGAVKRWGDDATETVSFASDAATKTGLTERSIRGDVQLATDAGQGC